jgi:hypothetical protein
MSGNVLGTNNLHGLIHRVSSSAFSFQFREEQPTLPDLAASTAACAAATTAAAVHRSAREGVTLPRVGSATGVRTDG